MSQQLTITSPAKEDWHELSEEPICALDLEKLLWRNRNNYFLPLQPRCGIGALTALPVQRQPRE